jgi:hypothetical protein
MEMSETTRQLQAPNDNPRTRVVSAEELACAGEPLGPREAFLLAYERLAHLASVARGPAMLVAAVGGQEPTLNARVIADRSCLIIGRHTQCGLRLTDGAVSLRHIAALVRFEDNRPMLRLWDLNTGLHFLSEDQQAHAAMIAAGPIYLAIGGYALWFVPASGIGAGGWPARAADAWDALPARVFIDERSPFRERRSEPWPPARQAEFDGEHTTITSVAPPLLLGDDDTPEVAWGVLRLERGPLRQERAVSAERLEQGILVGRYERCGLLMSADNSEISRVHLLLVRIGTEVWAIHTASTNGLFRGEVAIDAEVLGDADALTLGTDVTLRWKRAEHPEA